MRRESPARGSRSSSLHTRPRFASSPGFAAPVRVGCAPERPQRSPCPATLLASAFPASLAPPASFRGAALSWRVVETIVRARSCSRVRREAQRGLQSTQQLPVHLPVVFRLRRSPRQASCEPLGTEESSESCKSPKIIASVHAAYRAYFARVSIRRQPTVVETAGPD